MTAHGLFLGLMVAEAAISINYTYHLLFAVTSGDVVSQAIRAIGGILSRHHPVVGLERIRKSSEKLAEL